MRYLMRLFSSSLRMCDCNISHPTYLLVFVCVGFYLCVRKSTLGVPLVLML